MSIFEALCRERRLNKESSFEAISQACIEAYYLIPYPGKENQAPKGINRPLHGGLHAARTALCAELFIALHNKYLPHLVNNAEGSVLTAKDITLLKLAAVYHDSANTSEMDGIPEEQANNFKKDMLILGFTEQELEPFVTALINKDAPYPQSFYSKIIHDADCLEIIRCRDEYNPTYLHIYKDMEFHPNFPDFLNELRQIIKNHTIAIFNMEWQTKPILHRQCEFNENCYIAVRKALARMFINSAVLIALAMNETLSVQSLLSAIDQNYYTIDILDLFNRSTSKFFCGLLFDHSLPGKQFSEFKEESLAPGRINCLLARVMPSCAFEEELEVLKNNQNALLQAGIKNAEDMRMFLANQITDPIKPVKPVFTPKGFKWRPATMIADNLPVALFNLYNVGVLIDPNAPETMISHFFKANAFSYLTEFGLFRYNRPKTGLKERGCLKALFQKIEEQNERRMGIRLDKNAHYYGQKNLRHSEVLGTYSDIVGIFLTDLEIHTITDALILQGKFGSPLKPLFLYSSGTKRRLFDEELKSILTNPHNHLENNDLTDTDKKLFAQIEKHFTELGDIFRDIQQSDPSTISAKNPLKYSFRHPCDFTVTCKGYVKNGIPVIELLLANDKIITQQTDKLPTFAKLFFEYAGKRLQLNYFDPMAENLRTLGIEHLKITLYTDADKKISYFITCNIVSGFNKTAVIKQLQDLLGLTQVECFDLDSAETVCFEFIDVQKISILTTDFIRNMQYYLEPQVNLHYAIC